MNGQRLHLGGRLPPWLFAESAGGIQISGDSGSGKSNLLAVLMQALAMRGQGFCLLDPHGDLARLLKRFCLSLGDRLRRKVHRIPNRMAAETGVHMIIGRHRHLQESKSGGDRAGKAKWDWD